MRTPRGRSFATKTSPRTTPDPGTTTSPRTTPMADKREIDAETQTETTGHEWDGIKELDTPMPRWWLWSLYATIVWGIGYVLLMPAWPLVNSATPGLLGWSSRGEVAADIAAHHARH